MVEDIKKALAAAAHAAKHGWASPSRSVFSNQAAQVLKQADKEDIWKSLEKTYSELVNQLVDYIEYGDPVRLTAKQRAKLNCQLLKQVLVHRAGCLMTATGQTFDAKNVYGLAFRKGELPRDEHFQMLNSLCMSADMFSWLLPDFSAALKRRFPQKPPAGA